jgi:hypothetical protein
MMTWWHLENAGSRGIEHPAATCPRLACQASSSKSAVLPSIIALTTGCSAE